MRHSSLVERDYRLEISARANVVNVEQLFFRLCGSRTLRWKGALNWTGAKMFLIQRQASRYSLPFATWPSNCFFPLLVSVFFWLGLVTA